MKKSVVALLHIGFWFCYFILILIMLGVYYRTIEDENIQELRIGNAFKTIFIFAIVPSAISFYTFYLLLFPKYLLQKRFLLSVIYGLLISLLSALAGYIIMKYFMEMECIVSMDKSEDPDVVGVILFMAFIALICGIVALVIKGFITWFDEIKLKEQLKEKNHEMEMALIKSQLDPHFLFNTINNIDVLILKNATNASNYLNKLSDIMRFMLYETKGDKILLSKEMEYIGKYIALQKIRTANSTYVNFQVTGTAGSKIIAPMIFIPFIENAFKHTSNKKLDNAISIDIIINDESIQLLCENKFSSTTKMEEDNNGLGNELIKKRLKLIYPNNHTLAVTNKNELYSVHLIITNGQL